MQQHQMVSDRVLYVCAQGVIRSRTAEVLSILGGIEARSCGTDIDALVPATNTLATWAHVIVCMESEHRRCVSEFMGSEGKQIICLELPDVYRPFQPALIRDLVSHLDGHRWLQDSLRAGEWIYRRAVSSRKKTEQM